VSVGPLGHISDVMVLFLVSHFNFLFVPCGGLSWLPVSFLLHVKYTPSYCIVWRKGNINRTVYLLQYCLPCNHAQWHKQFLLVGQMDCALVLLNLALSSEHLCISVLWSYIHHIGEKRDQQYLGITLTSSNIY